MVLSWSAMAFHGALATAEATGHFEFFWFVFVLNVGLFLLVVTLPRFAYSTHAACPVHYCSICLHLMPTTASNAQTLSHRQIGLDVSDRSEVSQFDAGNLRLIVVFLS